MEKGIDKSRWVIIDNEATGKFTGFKTLTPVTIVKLTSSVNPSFNNHYIESGIEVEGDFTYIKVDKGTILGYLK